MEELEKRAAGCMNGVQFGKIKFISSLKIKFILICCIFDALKRSPLLTDWIDSKSRVGRCAEWSSSCRIAGSNPEFVLCTFDQTSHLGDTERCGDSTDSCG